MHPYFRIEKVDRLTNESISQTLKWRLAQSCLLVNPASLAPKKHT